MVAVAQSRVETIDEIRQRLLTALNYIDRNRLIAAPDCGLGLLGRDLAMHKLTNLFEAARHILGRGFSCVKRIFSKLS